MLLRPGLGMPLQELGAAIRYQGALTAREREIAILAVAASTASEFEAWAHERVAAAIGLEPAEIAAIADGTFGGHDARERCCCELAGRLARRGSLDDAAFREATAVLGPADLSELVALVGYHATLALVLDVFDVGVPADPEAGRRH
ncbi:carboxymuconolactone decarboxylase family protein [Nocardioides sp. L-11A]|uniref:carboxymuconolactone decarboxylase family protein n=1 Tax=Nocardioides sp. L-11A TaxID=3043848 RepID=UPI00249B68C3|nr:carboxymuconolactone decarboxylase family protein [Nocardioides sp. L-11A]